MTTPAQSMIRLLLFTLALLIAGGCLMADFEERYEVNRVRILNVAADPPDVGPSEEVQLSALVASPDADPEVEVDWTLCLFIGAASDGYPCLELEDVEGAEGFSEIPLGSGLELGFTNPFDAQDIDEFCALLESELAVPCDDGIPLNLRVSVRPEGQEEIITLRTLRFLTQELADRPDRNRNPQVRSLIWNETPLTADEITEVPYVPEEWNELLAAVSADEAETFSDRRTGEERQEELNAVWFTTAGELERSRGFFGPRAPLSELQSNRLRFINDRDAEVGDELTLWIVLRDNRGGSSSIMRRVRLVEPSGD